MSRDQGQFENYQYSTTRLVTYDSRGGVNVVKTGPGFLHAVNITQLDAVPTAGAITIYDQHAAIYGTTAILFKHTQTAAVFMPVSVVLDVPFNTGLSVGFQADLKDLAVTLTYK